MKLVKWGGIAAIIEALTYIFGFVLFFVILDASAYTTPLQKVEFLIEHRDTFFAGYLVCGIIFSFALILLVQGCYLRFKQYAPELMQYATVVGYIWATIVLASAFIFISSTPVIASTYLADPQTALTIKTTTGIVIDALGGGIELVGAIWVLVISYVGIHSGVYNKFIHYWGVLVGTSGVLTLFVNISAFSANSFFELTTAIFGLGQILWFLALGIMMLSDQEHIRPPKT